LTLIALIAACGQKGPLYLPEKKSTSAPIEKPVQSSDKAKTENNTPA
jgi:predicted small lipoprotein YifL